MSEEEGSRERKEREEDDEVVVVGVAVVGETAEKRKGKRENKRQVRTLR